MSHKQEHEPIDHESERLLRSFAPQPARLDRDRLMYLAGQASANTPVVALPTSRPQRAWLWPASTAAMTGVSALLLLMLLSQPTPAERIVIRDRIVAAPAALELPVDSEKEAIATSGPPETENPLLVAIERNMKSGSPDSYLRARNLALAQGIDAWERPIHSGGGDVGPSSYRELREQLLPRKAAVSAANRPVYWPQILLDEMSM